MNKTLIAAVALLIAASTATAGTVQVQGGRGSDNNYGFVGVTEKVLGVDTQVGYSNQLSKGPRADAISVGVTPTLFTVGKATVSGFAGGQFARDGKKEGFGVTYGVGASYPINKTVDAVVDFRQVRGQNRIKSQDGNTTYAGVSVKF